MTRITARRRLAAAGVLGTALAATLTFAAPARADSTVDMILWQNCQQQSSASLSFDATQLNWLDGTTLRWNAGIGKDCGTNVQVQIRENTRQSNDNPQTIGLGWGGNRTIASSAGVIPVRSLSWSVWLLHPLGSKAIGTAAVNIQYPQGPLPNGQTSFTASDGGVATRRAFVQAVETPGATVKVAANVTLNLSGLEDVRLAPNVQIIGDRTAANPLGPLVFTDTIPKQLFHVPAYTDPSQERITGLRLRGGASSDPFDNMGDEDSNGVLIEKPNVEIGFNEMYLWRGTAVQVLDCDDCDSKRNLITRDNGNTIRVHDNYIHHDQHPTGEIGGGHGAGYGVAVDHGAYVLVDRNVFDYNRHSMTAGGQDGTGYRFYRNLILPNGGVNSRVSSTHAIDVHGSNKDDSYQSGQAGEYFDVEYNTVWNIHDNAIKLRGTPTDKMEVHNNVYAHCGLFTTSAGCSTIAAIHVNETGMSESNDVLTTFGADPDDARTTCDFDGDGVNDTFHATRITWWFQSSRLGGRYIYLNQSTAAGSAVTLGDKNGDGLCDVTANGQVFASDPNVTIGPGQWTSVPFLVTNSDAIARTALQQAGLNLGTVTIVPSTVTKGTVLDQSQHFNYIRPKGTAVNLTESGGGVLVPDVVGSWKADALAAISGAGLTNDTPSEQNTCVDPGQVFQQSPKAGTLVQPGATVHISVATCIKPGGGGGTPK
ncbi:PASTA domain-containing protein [Dactylosporangium vinaceum]|uniref:PASTA domain-containing protein n=1 Tax=Dactylosporangium vinaceum TaxID=53362 RepID=A0ABV5MLK4_9ACTN|nr:PASTA domain-containing protein [Dactylosporangium vinaceum]UAB96946.1 PASTA domain-containing protein [Dactylosporangium vinaceum]